MHLVKINGIEYKLPQSCKDITAKQFIMFTKQLELAIYTDDLYQNTIQLAECLCKFWGIDIKELADVDAVDSNTEDFYNARDFESYNDIAGMVNVIRNVIDNFIPTINLENHSFVYKGDTWDIPKFIASKFVEEHTRPVMKFGDMIKLAEAKRVANDFISLNKDIEGSYHFTDLKYTVALLAKNKELDAKMSFEEKIMYFDEIDYESAANLCFFLINIYTELSMTPDFITSLIHQN